LSGGDFVRGVLAKEILSGYPPGYQPADFRGSWTVLVRAKSLLTGPWSPKTTLIVTLIAGSNYTETCSVADQLRLHTPFTYVV